jgi:hypothetical protein
MLLPPSARRAADLLAWQWRLESKRRLDLNRNRKIRADLEALVRPQDRYMDWNGEELQGLELTMNAKPEERLPIIQRIFDRRSASTGSN